MEELNIEKLHIELQFSDRTYNTFLIEGMTIRDQNRVLNSDSWEEMRSTLIELLDEYDNDYQPGHSLGTCWGCGYGIYGINHFGGHLLVKVGKSCD